MTKDVFTSRADLYIQAHAPTLIVSDFGKLEFSSVIARRVRTQEVTATITNAFFSGLDAWMIRNTERVETAAADVTTAARFIRRLDLTLRTADAVNLAITQRIEATLMTFDETMAVAARALGNHAAAA